MPEILWFQVTTAVTDKWTGKITINFLKGDIFSIEKRTAKKGKPK